MCSLVRANRSALTWAWALLAADPVRQDRLRAEALAVLGDRPATSADLPSLPYARAVLDEAMRLFPPAWLITRTALADTVVGGCAIPAGALVIISPWLVHRHPERWQHPDRFEPERFVDQEPPRDAFVAFGAGPRMCIGREFAYAEAVPMLAALARRVRLEYPPGRGVPRASALVTLRPAGGLSLLRRW